MIGRRFGKLVVVEQADKEEVIRTRPGKLYDSTFFWARCDCGKKHLVSATGLRGGTKSCGCGKHKRGKEHPNWRADLTDEERERNKDRARNFPNYKKWYLSVFHRDAFSCVVCGDNRGGNLEPHHIEGWNWAKNRRFDTDNGVTLCETCHDRFHGEYGRGSNTARQWSHYLKEVLNGR